MQNKRKIIRIAICTILIVFLLPLNYTIADTNTFTTELTSTSKLIPGSTVEILWSITEININPGIISIGGVLQFDEDVFEQITDDEEMFDAFDGQNRWSIQSYNYITESDMYGTFLISRPTISYVKRPGDIAKIILKVKDDATATSSTVTITDVVSSGGMETGDVESPNVSITITSNGGPDVTPTITSTPTTPEQPTATPITEVTPTPEQSPTNDITPTPTEEVPTPTATGVQSDITPTPNATLNITPTPSGGGTEIPDAGQSSILIGITMVIIAIGVFSFIRYKNMENNIK